MLALYHLARADFLERVRRYSFLVMLLLTIYLGYGVNTGAVTVRLDQYRGVYNSAWVGGMMSLVVTSIVSLAGFYLVKNAIERDRQTGVGEILATTPLSRPLYVTGKTLSNFAVLACLVVVLAVAAVLFQILQREDPRIDLVALLAPLVWVALPFLLLIAALAVFFEAVPGLRGGFGNVAFFFLFSALLIGSMAESWLLDPSGLYRIGIGMRDAAKAVFPDYGGGLSVSIGPEAGPAQGTFRWEGVAWTLPVILQRLWNVGLAGVVVLGAALAFDRFDPARAGARGRKPKQVVDTGADLVTEVQAAPTAPAAAAISAAHLTGVGRNARFLGAWIAELRLALEGTPRVWRLVALGLLIAGVAAPLKGCREWVLPLAWIWPVLVWSGLGARERRHRTESLVFSAAHSLGRQLPAAWLAGVGVAALTGLTVAIRLLLAGDFGGLGAWVVGALFIPSLALACGVWSGSGKLFEALYTMLWYVGPMHQVPSLDYLGATRQGIAQGMPVVYAISAAALLALAFVGRKRQLDSG